MEQENNEKEIVSEEETKTSTETTDNEELEEVNEDETAEFEDESEEGSHESEEEKSKKQSKEDNHRFAEMRRAKEQAEKEEKARKEAYNKGLMDAVGNKNPYTGEKMEDEFDIETFRKMREIEKRGGDPVEDYAKYDKIFRKEEHEKQLESQRKEIETQERIENDKKAFREKYPDVNLADVLADKKFKAFGKRSIDHGDSICDVYADYLEFNSEVQQNVNQEVERKSARMMASPGSLSSTGENQEKSVLDMTDDEFRKFRLKIGLDQG